MENKEILIYLVMSFIVLLLALFPFWVSLFVHYRKKFNLLGRFKFSVLCSTIVYGSMMLFTVLLIPLVFIAIKIHPHFAVQGKTDFYWAHIAYEFSQSGWVLAGLVFSLSLVIPFIVVRYLNELHNSTAPNKSLKSDAASGAA